MNARNLGTVAAAAALLLASPAFPQGEKEGQGTAIVTILPKHEGDAAPSVSPPALNLKVNGKEARVTHWIPLKGTESGVELVLLIDSGARTSLGQQLEDISQFVKSLPPNVKATVGYMQNGHAALTGPLTSDHAAVLKGLHLPGGSAGSNASPYFCISDLAKNWPSQDTTVRRETLLVTDGVDEYDRRFDSEDPYMQSAINDSVKAGIVVYSIYWRNQGRADNTAYANNAGQSLMMEVTDATGGKSFWEGMGNPVSFAPFLDELSRRLRNQYELSFTIPFNGKPQVEPMKLKFSAPGNEIDSPREVFVAKPGVAQN